MRMYNSYQSVQSLSYNKIGHKRLGDFHFASAYNPCHNNNQYFTYLDFKITRSVLQTGVRCIHISLFNDSYGEDALPVISEGFKEGEWKMTLNYLDFDEFCYELKQNIFSIKKSDDNGVPNPDDPFIICLNLKTNYNIHCLNRAYESIVRHFRHDLLHEKYNYQQSNIADAPMNDLKKKIIIFSSSGFEGSKLEEVINYSWSDDSSELSYIYKDELQTDVLDKGKMIKYNKKNMTIIVPHQEGDYKTSNYNTQDAFDSGCQFIMMNYHYIDEYMDYYIT